MRRERLHAKKWHDDACACTLFFVVDYLSFVHLDAPASKSAQSWALNSLGRLAAADQTCKFSTMTTSCWTLISVWTTM
jgi:hypothetical protein